MLELLWMIATVVLIGHYPNLPLFVKIILYLNFLPQTYLLLVKANRKLEERNMEKEFLKIATTVDTDTMPEAEDMERVFDAMERQKQSDQQVEARLVHMYGEKIGQVVYARWLAGGRQQKFDDIEGMAHG